MINFNSTTSLSEVGLMLEKEGIEEQDDETKYNKIINSLQYLCHAQLDIKFVLGAILRYMQNSQVSYLLTISYRFSDILKALWQMVIE